METIQLSFQIADITVFTFHPEVGCADVFV